MENKKKSKKNLACDAADYVAHVSQWYKESYLKLPQWAKDDLAKSNITIQDTTTLPIFPVSSTKELQDILGYTSFDGQPINPEDTYAFKYPIGFTRIKLREKIGDAKYLSPKKDHAGHGSHRFYVTPVDDNKPFKSTNGITILCEGEKKTIATQQALVTENIKGHAIGIPGVSMSLPAILQVYENLPNLRISGRTFYIAFDCQDYQTHKDENNLTIQDNYDVQLEALKLWFLLWIKKAKVVNIMLWDVKYKGIDDALKAGIPLATMIDYAVSDPFEAFPALSSCAGFSLFSTAFLACNPDARQFKDIYNSLELGQKFPTMSKAEFLAKMQEAAKRKSSQDARKLQAEIKSLPTSQNPDEIAHIPGLTAKTSYIVKQSNDKTITGVWKEYVDEDNQKVSLRICSDAVRITERMNDIFGGTALIKVEWGKNKTKIFPMRCTSGKDMTLLTDAGITINSTNGKDMSEYFLARLNQIETETSFASTNGWKDESCSEFVAGNKIISKDRIQTIESDPDNPMVVGEKGDQIAFQKIVTRFLANDPQAQICLATAIAAALCEPLNSQSVILHLYGDSSQGKSWAACQIAGSLFGQATPGKKGNIVSQWAGTLVGHERYFAYMQNLPCFLDDSQSCPDEKILSSVVQLFANCKGKSRGGIDRTNGLGNMTEWKTFLLSTGEKALSDQSTFSGQESRIFQMHRTCYQNFTPVDFLELNEILSQNYGFGINVIQYFLSEKDSCEKAYMQIVAELSKRWEKLPKTKTRCLTAVATILLAGRLTKQVLATPFDESKVLEEFDKILGTEDAPKGSAGLYELINELYTSHETMFGTMQKRGSSNTYQYVPYDTLAREEWGVYHTGEKALYVYANILREYIEKRGYSLSQISMIKDKIITDSPNRNQRLVSIRGKMVRVYAFLINIAE